MLSNTAEGTDDSKEAMQSKHIVLDKKHPIVIDLDDEETIFEEKYVGEDTEKGVVFQLKVNSNTWVPITPQFIKIHPWKRYKFSMEVKKTSDSSPFLRIQCYDKDYKEITSYDLLRSSDPVIINNVSSDGTKIICDRLISKKWKGFEQKFEIRAYQRWIGFYFDGNYDKLRPNAYIKHHNSWSSTDPKDGAYCNIQGKIIYLSKPINKDIQDKIKTKETLIDNHFGGDTHIWWSLSNYPSDQWFNISNLVQGACINYGVKDNQENNYKFRKGTRFIKLLFTSSGGTALFKSCKIEQVDID